MAEPLRSPSPYRADDPGTPPDPGTGSGTRRWVVVLWIVLAVGVLGLIVFLHLSGAIGPGAH